MNRIVQSVLFLSFFVAICRADPVKLELGELAKHIAANLKDVKSVRLGRFISRGEISSNFGPEINRVLGKELMALGVQIDPKAQIEVNGDYRLASGAPDEKLPEDRIVHIRLNVKLVNADTGDIIMGIQTQTRSIFGEASVARALAVPVIIPTNASTQQANDVIRQSYETPKFALKGNAIKCSSGSMFAVEMLVVTKKDAPDPLRGADVQRTPQGLPFIHVERGQYFRLRIYNDADFGAAVQLSINGIDQFAYSDPSHCNPDGTPRFSFRIIPAHSSTIISGWFRNINSFDHFIVVDYAQSAAAELKRVESDVGQIALEFHACWEADAQPPADESSHSRSPTTTGREPGGQEHNAEVIRKIGVLREVIGLRFGSQTPE